MAFDSSWCKWRDAWKVKINLLLHITRYDPYPSYYIFLLQWRHNERDCVSNQWRLDCLLNRSLSHRSKQTSKLRVTGLCEGKPPATGGFLSHTASNAENVSIWWRHHVINISDIIPSNDVSWQSNEYSHTSMRVYWRLRTHKQCKWLHEFTRAVMMNGNTNKIPMLMAFGFYIYVNGILPKMFLGLLIICCNFCCICIINILCCNGKMWLAGASDLSDSINYSYTYIYLSLYSFIAIS